MNTPEEEFQFKVPTADNWLEVDSVWQVWVRFSDVRNALVPREAESWIAETREAQLSSSAPIEVRRLFEVARSCIIYGFLCYPLLTLGIEQLHRVLETATRMKADALGCPRKKRKGEPDELASFGDSIDWLNQSALIADCDLGSWRAAKSLRNYASHPTMQSIQPPGRAIGELYLVAERINALFQPAS